MHRKQSIWMGISGATGLMFFIIANFTSVFEGSAVIAAFCQIAVNTFVLVVWSKAFFQRSGFKRFVAFWGIVFPITLGGITIVRVIVPWLISLF